MVPVGGGGGLCVQARDPRAAVGGVLAAGGQRHARLLYLWQSHARGQVGAQGRNLGRTAANEGRNYTKCVNTSVAEFARKFLLKFLRPVGHTKAAVQPGRKKMDRGTCTKTF